MVVENLVKAESPAVVEFLVKGEILEAAVILVARSLVVVNLGHHCHSVGLYREHVGEIFCDFLLVFSYTF